MAGGGLWGNGGDGRPGCRVATAPGFGSGPARSLLPLTLALLALLSPTRPARAAEILAVVSAKLPAYEAALDEFRTHLARLPAAGPKAVQPHTVSAVFLSEDGPAGLLRGARARRPALILTLGRAALDAAAELSDRIGPPAVPILYLLAPGIPPGLRGRPNVTGVDLEVPPAATLAALRDLLPGISRVGLIHDPKRTGPLAKAALEAAQGAGMTLTVLPVGEAREVPARLEELIGRVDALWLLPDLTVASPEAVGSLVLFSQRHRVPVVAFSRQYAERGAALTVDADLSAMAGQAARMVRRLLAGEPPSAVPPESPSRVVVTANRAVATRLGLELNRAARQTVEWVE